MSEWIKCDIGCDLPEPNTGVLVASSSGVIYTALFDHGWHLASRNSGFVFITHWMPLPEPPKE